MSSAKSFETIASLQARTSARRVIARCPACRWTRKCKTDREAALLTREHLDFVKRFRVLGHSKEIPA